MSTPQNTPPKAETVTAEPAAAPSQSLLDQIMLQEASTRASVASRYKPVMSIEEMIQRDEAIRYLVDRVMHEGIDYGWVPGTKPKPNANAQAGEYEAKPTLFKAGAETACAFFGYVPNFIEIEKIEAWNDDEYGEMLFYFEYRCTLEKDGHAVGQGIGSASTWESKYRYRNSERTCPDCGKANIRKSKLKPGQKGEPGFYCWDRTGGCGAAFEAQDPRIIDQVLGKTANPDIADVINTVMKMAQKRSYVAATLTATGLSGRFTQDIEDNPRRGAGAEEERGSDRGNNNPPQQTERGENDAPPERGSRRPAPAAAGDPAAANGTTVVNGTQVQELTPLQQFQVAFRGADRGGRVQIFGELKEALGEELYGDFLAAAGVQRADQFDSLRDAMICASKMKDKVLAMEKERAHA